MRLFTSLIALSFLAGCQTTESNATLNNRTPATASSNLGANSLEKFLVFKDLNQDEKQDFFVSGKSISIMPPDNFCFLDKDVEYDRFQLDGLRSETYDGTLFAVAVNCEYLDQQRNGLRGILNLDGPALEYYLYKIDGRITEVGATVQNSDLKDAIFPDWDVWEYDRFVKNKEGSLGVVYAGRAGVTRAFKTNVSSLPIDLQSGLGRYWVSGHTIISPHIISVRARSFPAQTPAPV